MLSISFADFHFGLHGAKEVLCSGRIKGCAQKHYAAKRKLVQKPPLTVDQVLTLEKTVLSPARTDADRIVAGFFLMLVYGRLQYRDGQQLSNLSLDMPNADQGFLEGIANKKEMSIATPTMSLLGEPWVPTWLELREKAFGSKTDIGTFPLLPSPTGTGWREMPLTVIAGSQWLRALVPGQEGPEVSLRPHSCKATVVSWFAKRGMPHGPRRLLGHRTRRKIPACWCTVVMQWLIR